MADSFIQHTSRSLLYMVLTTLLLSTFLMNWSFLDGTNWNSLRVALDGTAHQPVVYRRLMPATVNLVRASLPPEAKHTLSETVAPQFHTFYVLPLIAHYEKSAPAMTKQASLDWEDPEYRVGYVLMYYLCWICLFLSLYVMRLIASHLAKGAQAVIGVKECAPVIAILCLPFSFLNGGYFYDFAEFLLLSLALYAGLRGNLFVLALALTLAVVNKETAWLFAIFLAPILHKKWGTKKTAMSMVVMVPFLILVAQAIRFRYASNPGSAVGLALFNNLQFWADVANWRAVGDHIGRGFFFPRLALLFLLALGFVYGWKTAKRDISLAAVASLLGSAFLLLFIGFRDELRNLSLAFPLFYAFVVSAYIEKTRMNPKLCSIASG